MYHTEKALYTGLKELKAGAKLGNASARIEQYAKRHGLGVVRELVGHGVGPPGKMRIVCIRILPETWAVTIILLSNSTL